MKMKKDKNWIYIFIISLIVCFLPGILGSLVIGNETQSSWYQTIKPSITPPNWVFPIVWNILFFLIACSLTLAWLNSSKKQKRKIILIYGINLISNFLWSFIYFKLHNPILAFADIILIIITIIIAMVFTYKINKKSSWLLLPYLIWVIFASFLNYLSI